MAANPNDPRTKRRKAMGDDPNKVAMAPQPLPGAPQDQKAGNVMNYPVTDTQGQMGQPMGKGGIQFPYGDMAIDADTQSKMGSVGIAGRSNVPENIVPGTGSNSVFAYNAAPNPDPQSMMMMEPNYEIAQASGQTLPGGPQKLFGMGMPPYQVSAMGPTGGAPVPGGFPPSMQYSMPDDLPIQGSMGMNTGRGGGRNQGTGKK